MVKTKTKKSTKKVEYEQQQRQVIAFCWVSHGTYTWSIGRDPNIIHATRCVRKAKRDYGLKGWQVIPVSIFDIEDTEHWAFDGMTLVTKYFDTSSIAPITYCLVLSFNHSFILLF